jgi:aryl-alcohol dehydrogenase-like predicted oxidoreductase
MEAVSAALAGTHNLGDGLVVNRLGYGAMRITGDQVWGPPEDIDLAIRVLRRATELGVNFIDTADSYGPSVSEELIAEALEGYGEVVVATKGGLRRPTAPEWTNDARPDHLRMALEGSLKRLRVERIDLYQLHAPDPDVPYEDSIGALKEMQDAGKIRLIGVSNVDLEELEIARGIVDVVSVQNRYNLVDRSSDEVLDRCEELGIAFLPWFPLATGDLAEGGRRRAGRALKRVAERLQATPAQVALAWLLARSPVVIPIPGTTSLTHLEENVAAGALQLSEEDYAELEEVA